MIKKIICIFFILGIVVVTYRIVNKKSIFDENLFLEKKFCTRDVISFNKDNLYGMAGYVTRNAINGFKKNFPCEVDIVIKPLSEKIGTESVLMEKKYNDKPRIIFYEKDKVIYTGQMNTWLLTYLYHPDITLHPIEEYLRIPDSIQLINWNNENKDGSFSFLPGRIPDMTVEVSDQLREYDISLNEYVSVYNAARLHFALLAFFVQKLTVMSTNPSVEVNLSHDNIKVLDAFRKDERLWPLVFADYQFEKHWLRYELLYYRDLILFFLSIIALIFFIIQFRRKNLKLIIKKELETYHISLTPGLVYKIFWQNWGCLFYQARDSKVHAKIGEIAKNIADDIRDKNLTRRAKNYWKAFENSDLPEPTKLSLAGNYRKATVRKVSFPNRDNAVNVLANHLYLLTEPADEHDTAEPEIKKAKREKGISDKERLCLQIHNMSTISQSLLNYLSTRNLYDLILAIEVLPQINSSALGTFFEIGAKKILDNHKFIGALHTKDKPIILECLRIKTTTPDVANEIVDAPINRELLNGKNVIFIGGRNAEKKRNDFAKWTYSLGATDVRYVSGDKPRKIEAIMKKQTVDLFILHNDTDHLILNKLKSRGQQKFIWVNSYLETEYLKEVNNFLNII